MAKKKEKPIQNCVLPFVLSALQKHVLLTENKLRTIITLLHKVHAIILSEMNRSANSDSNFPDTEQTYETKMQRKS